MPKVSINTQFTNVQTVGILFDATDIINYGVVQRYAEEYKQMGKEITLFAFVDADNPNPDLEFGFFSRKDINWFHKPDSLDIIRFIEQDFDVLINAYLEEKEPLLYISTLSNAVLRVGMYFANHRQASDVLITIRREQTLDNFFKEINYYLNIFKHEGQ